MSNDDEKTADQQNAEVPGAATGSESAEAKE